MKLRDYIMLFDDRCTCFIILTKLKKWFFYVEPGGDTRKKLIDAVMKVDELSKLKINGFKDAKVQYCGGSHGNALRFIISFK